MKLDITTNNAPICNVGLHKTEHLLSCLRHAHEYTTVNLQKAEKLKDFSGFGCNLVDTIPRVSGHGFRSKLQLLLTLGYVQRIAPWVEQGRRNRRMHALPASDESLPSPLKGIPSQKIRHA
jgi:hypothetical protein